MHEQKIFISTLLLVSAHLTTSTAPHAAPQAVELLRAAERAPFPGVGDEPNALRRRAVEVDVELLAGARAPAELRLALFDGLAVTARLARLEPALGGGLLWSGDVPASPGSSVLLSASGDAVSGSIRFDDRLFRLAYAGNGVHLVTELDETAFPECGTAERGVVRDEGAAAPDAPPPPTGARSPLIDVMVVYSPAAKNQTGGTSAMNSLINLAVAETNQAYQTSGIAQRLVLVHTEEMVGYVEPGSFGQILIDLEGKGDGKLDSVHPLRDQHGADAVTMICNNNQYCGIANLMTFVSHSFEDRAFNVVNRGCATGYYSFGHELAHNFGATHDPGNAGGAAYSFAYGYRTPDNRYRTIMAYSPGTRVQLFSGPGVQHQGYTMGTPSQDNVRCLDATASTVAGWRVPSTPPVLVVPPLVSGAHVTFEVSACTPSGQVFVASSLTGPGPLQTVFGPVSLSAPIMLFPEHVANASGEVSLPLRVPAGMAGLTVWLQAVDVGKALLSNPTQRTIN